MATEKKNITLESTVEYSKQASRATAKRLIRFFFRRLILLMITIVVGVYITIIVANMGGYVDVILKSSIREEVTMEVAAIAAKSYMTEDVRRELIERGIQEREKLAGLDQPFVRRSLTHLKNALTLNFGRARFMISDHGSRYVRNIILERLPATLLLMGTSQLLLFVVSLFLALAVSRHYGSFWDKLIVALSPTSSIPPWFYGIFLILFFAAWLKILPFGGMVDAPPPPTKIGYFLSVLKHMILPAFSLFISSFMINTYSWRTFFLIYSSEDYVDMAKAKGLSSRAIERRYILRPTMPSIITSFALMLVGIWTGATLTETVFLWPGLGTIIYQAVSRYDTAVIVGTTIIQAYLLGITVFLLDFLYAIVDPRVKLGGSK
ncbi:MAG: ABC transporter permease [Clostridiaceae bacterium]|jgi:peptide/nickel transport system permease protein|nr:ABC transporter permease [Clostridiaceae bacterium]